VLTVRFSFSSTWIDSLKFYRESYTPRENGLATARTRAEFGQKKLLKFSLCGLQKMISKKRIQATEERIEQPSESMDEFDCCADCIDCCWSAEKFFLGNAG
jgi:hypothetical protein